MIVFNLCCPKDHRFEGWFASAEAFDHQAQDGMLSCPLCGSVEVNRLPSGPRIISRETSSAPEPQVGAETLQNLANMLKAISDAAMDAEDVAERFPEEARKIHYGEVPARGIRGQASLDDTRELLEEGIPVLPLPLPYKGKPH